jgi:hypothetical protein
VPGLRFLHLAQSVFERAHHAEQRALYGLAEMFTEAAAPIDLVWSSGDIEVSDVAV